jgi:hypothetical protein
MNNHEIINTINKIVNPFFIFEMNDFYGDRGGIPFPKIEELQLLAFKKNGKDKKLNLTKEQETLIINKIKDLNIGSVEIVKIQAFGTYIMINLQNKY